MIYPTISLCSYESFESPCTCTCNNSNLFCMAVKRCHFTYRYEQKLQVSENKEPRNVSEWASWNITGCNEDLRTSLTGSTSSRRAPQLTRQATLPAADSVSTSISNAKRLTGSQFGFKIALGHQNHFSLYVTLSTCSAGLIRLTSFSVCLPYKHVSKLNY
jgi:hypothetical protein